MTVRRSVGKWTNKATITARRASNRSRPTVLQRLSDPCAGSRSPAGVLVAMEAPARTPSYPLLRSPVRPASTPSSGTATPAPQRWFSSPARQAGRAAASPRGLLLLVTLALIGGAVLAWLLARDPAAAAAYVAMCLIVKDQPRDVMEWVQYHRSIGVEKFYIYDHSSSVPLVKELYPLVNAGVVEYRYFREFTHPSGFPQTWVFDQCLLQSHAHRFMIFVDTDEFVVLKGEQRLPQVLSAYEKYGALVPNVRIFGSSGHLTRPPSTVNAYTSCAPLQEEDNKHVKVIANTRYTAAAGPDPHTFIYRPGKYAVTERLARVDGAKSAVVSEDKIIIHHYATRSREEFQDKVQRGPAHGLIGKTVEFFNAIDALSTEVCYTAIKDPEAQHLAEVWQAHLKLQRQRQIELARGMPALPVHAQQQTGAGLQGAGQQQALTKQHSVQDSVQAEKPVALPAQQQQQQQQGDVAGAADAGLAGQVESLSVRQQAGPGPEQASSRPQASAPSGIKSRRLAKRFKARLKIRKQDASG